MATNETEQQLLAAFSVDEMFKHLEKICSWDRLSGGPGESAAVDYVAEVLRGYGLPVEIYEFEAYLSNPIHGGLQLVGQPDRLIKAKTRAFSASTPEGGVVGELVYVPGGSDMFRDTETRKRIEALDLRGKVVLSEGGGRSNMIAAQAKGAVGYIHMWPSDEPYVHEGTVSPVWGSPTPEGFELLPKIPVVQITNEDGQYLRDLAAQEAVAVRLTTRTQNGFKTLRLPVTEIKGATDDFVLIAGHIDSWHLGVTDNGTGNVACLELARLFGQFQDQLRRGVRIAWWPGHSNGRYAGSTWYADHFWQELHDHCVGYLNIDSPGSLGATDYSLITAVAETAGLGLEVVGELTGQQVNWERPVRAGDQSFWGVGISSLYMLLSNRPEGQRAAVGGCGMGWWWHTEEDTMDKADPAVLLLDTQIHGLTAFRLATAELLPLDPGALVAELIDELSLYERQTAGHLDFTPALERLTELATALGQMQSAHLPADEQNRVILKVIRALTPVNYTASGQFQHDAAVPAKPLPGLAEAPRLAALDRRSNDYGFLRTKLVRECNRVVAAANTALDAVGSALEGKLHVR